MAASDAPHDEVLIRRGRLGWHWRASVYLVNVHRWDTGHGRRLTRTSALAAGHRWAQQYIERLENAPKDA